MLKSCYEGLKRILGNNIEPFNAVKLVERYREYWTPKPVKIVLLAESHVFTNKEDIEIKFKSPLDDYPDSYAKFVYCLAYGERELTANINHPARDGTPHFWKVFYSCVNRVSKLEDFQPVLKKTNFNQRLNNKICLLKTLKKRGIWLIDASIIALYSMGEKPPQNIQQAVINYSWKNYTSGILKSSNPSYVICIGKGVGNVVENDLKRIMQNNYSIFPQPNARLGSEEHMKYFKKYFEICKRYSKQVGV